MLKTIRIKITTRRGKGDEYFKTFSMMYEELKKKTGAKNYYTLVSLANGLRHAIAEWSSDKGKILTVEYFTHGEDT